MKLLNDSYHQISLMLLILTTVGRNKNSRIEEMKSL
jgi:hypothetical protein